MTQVIHGSHTLTLPYTVLTHDTHAAYAPCPTLGGYIDTLAAPCYANHRMEV